MAHRNRLVTAQQRELLRERAAVMRHAPTASERALWQVLRARRLGVRFRRQVVLQGYIVDFYASEARLVVEVDGAWHGQHVAADRRRERVLLRAGYRVLRVAAEDIEQALPGVVAQVLAAIALPPRPWRPPGG